MSAIYSNNPNFVFCPPPPGKPNPNEPAVPGTMRSRVIQKGQKGATCQFYALQMLRNENKIGKVPSQEQLEMRNGEKLISAFRKQQTIADSKWVPLTEFATMLNSICPCTKKKAKELLSEIPSMPTDISEGKQELDKICITALRNFCEQEDYEDFYNYIEEEKYFSSYLSLYGEVLNALGVSYEMSKNDFEALSKKLWEDASCLEKSSYFAHCVFINSFHYIYKLKKSSWHPEKPITALIEQLQLHGPHLAQGHIGRAYYETAPIESRHKIQERPILRWKSSVKQVTQQMNHAVVIVGAEIKKDRECVYFIDPLDGSDPNDILTQKIYVISYRKLKSSISTLIGYLNKNPEGKPLFQPMNADGKNFYALHA